MGVAQNAVQNSMSLNVVSDTTALPRFNDTTAKSVERAFQEEQGSRE